MEEISVHYSEPTVKKLLPGRRPKYSISSLKEAADNNIGRWVSQVVSENAAKSYKRQFDKVGGYRVSISRVDDPKKRQVIVTRKAD